MIKFIHDPLQGYTAAYVVNHEDKSIAMAVAFCSPNDQFCKKIGRKISEGRLDLGLAGVKRPKVERNFRILDLDKRRPAEIVVQEVQDMIAPVLFYPEE